MYNIDFGGIYNLIYDQINKQIDSQTISYLQFRKFQKSFISQLEQYQNAKQIQEITDKIITPVLFASLPSYNSTTQNSVKKFVYKSDFLFTVKNILEAQKQFQIINKQMKLELLSQINLHQIQKILLLFQDQMPVEVKKFIDYYLYYAAYGIYTILQNYNEILTLQKLLSSQLLTAAIYLNSEYFQGRIYGPLSKFESYFTIQSFQTSYAAFSQASFHSPQLEGLLCQDDARYLPYAPTLIFTRNWYNTTVLYKGNIDYRSYVNYLCCLTFPGNYVSGKFVYDILIQYQTEQTDYLLYETIRVFVEQMLNEFNNQYPEWQMETEVLMSELMDDIKKDLNSSIACEYLIRFTTSFYSFIEREQMEQESDVKILDSQWNKL